MNQEPFALTSSTSSAIPPLIDLDTSQSQSSDTCTGLSMSSSAPEDASASASVASSTTSPAKAKIVSAPVPLPVGPVETVKNPFESVNIVPVTTVGPRDSAPTQVQALSPVPSVSLSGSTDPVGVGLGSLSLIDLAQVAEEVPSSPSNAGTATPPLYLPPEHQQQQQHHTAMFNDIDDDENTAPSSAANTEEQPSQIARFIEKTKRRLNTNTGNRKDSEDENFQGDGALIAGYLQKLGRNGKWQTRWFETDGECLSYYKSDKRSKLLATLDLQKVGLIETDTEDKMESSFRIQVLGRVYQLRADNRASCKDWVITLNRIKEARMEQGNVKLVGGAPHTIDLLDQQNNSHQRHQGTPRVVVVSNRQRTRAVDEDESWDQLIRVDNTEDPTDPAYISHKRRSALSSAVVARWSKRHSSFQRLGTKLSKWAKSLKKYSCADLEQQNNSVYLDRHVHPPGHDDKAKQQQLLDSKQQQVHPGNNTGTGLSSWIDKETAGSAQSVDPSALPSKPIQLKDRSMSTTSDYDARMLS